MIVISIDERCTACGACIVTCPERALRRAPRRPIVDAGRCTLCAACIEVCPVDAIHEGGLVVRSASGSRRVRLVAGASLDGCPNTGDIRP
jgi:ferredoxin